MTGLRTLADRLETLQGELKAVCAKEAAGAAEVTRAQERKAILLQELADMRAKANAVFDSAAGAESPPGSGAGLLPSEPASAALMCFHGFSADRECPFCAQEEREAAA